MKSKLMLITTVFIFMLQLDFQAATIYASDGTVIDGNSNICANDTYSYETDSSDMYEAEVVSTENKMLLTTFNANNGVIEFTFPANVEQLTIYIYDYASESRNLVDRFDFTVSDCGYESVVDDYKVSAPQVSFSKFDLGVTFTEPTVDNYKLYINQVEAEDDQKSKQVKFKDGVADVEITADIIQLTESYTNSKGKDTTRFYEVDLTDELIIRRVNNLELNIIQPMQYIDINILLRVLAGLIVLIILYLVNIKQVKKYRAKKRYQQRLKEIKAKRRQQLEAQKQEQELEKKRIHAERKRLEQERQRRANLEIRK